MGNTGKTRIILKTTGKALEGSNSVFSRSLVDSLANQVSQLSPRYFFGVVVGGGNIFRGSEHGPDLSLSAPYAHSVGMLATIMNGIIVHDIFQSAGINSILLHPFSGIPVGKTASQESIDNARANNDCIIFAGGTGLPFVSTDTNAVIRALQMNAQAVWKATNVDGVYEADPCTKPHAQFLKHISFEDAIKQQLGIMDLSALALASRNKLPIRVFNIFEECAVTHASQSPEIGSVIS